MYIFGMFFNDQEIVYMLSLLIITALGFVAGRSLGKEEGYYEGSEKEKKKAQMERWCISDCKHFHLHEKCFDKNTPIEEKWETPCWYCRRTLPDKYEEAAYDRTDELA